MQTVDTMIKGKLVNPAPHRRASAAKRSGHVTNAATPVQHQHGCESAGMIFIASFMDSFLHKASFATEYGCYDRHRSARLVICFDLAIDQIAQSGLSSLKVIYYSEHLFRWLHSHSPAT